MTSSRLILRALSGYAIAKQDLPNPSPTRRSSTSDMELSDSTLDVIRSGHHLSFHMKVLQTVKDVFISLFSQSSHTDSVYIKSRLPPYSSSIL